MKKLIGFTPAIIRLKLVENGSVKTITHVNDLKDPFPDIDIDHL